VSTDLYAYKAKPSRKRLKRLLFIVLFAVVAAVLLVSSYFLIQFITLKSKQSLSLLAKNWSEKAYPTVLESTNEQLAKEPLDPTLLMYNGFSSFYLSLQEYDGQKKNTYIQNTVRSLRKILINPDVAHLQEIAYVLGKAYFYMGISYYDLAEKYLLLAQEKGYGALDIDEYLGLIYFQQKKLQESLSRYLVVYNTKKEAPELLYAIAQCYAQLGDNKSAEDFLALAESRATDVFMLEQIRILLVDLYLQTSQDDKVMDLLGKIKENNPESADAYYKEGLYYSMHGDIIRARAAWRKALNIDPMHKEARQKLAER
jgi:tetratricopeptide (TPR) repeat protein